MLCKCSEHSNPRIAISIFIQFVCVFPFLKSYYFAKLLPIVFRKCNIIYLRSLETWVIPLYHQISVNYINYYNPNLMSERVLYCESEMRPIT